MSSSAFSAHDDHQERPQNVTKSSSGLTFVLPPLSAIKAQKAKKKIKLTYEEPVKKQPRPIKLKPLKEVLTKLIAQIKKKDDYGFFLQPVDPSQVPGYGDVISRPMDLGTMTIKVEKGKYRSLEDFASDLKLVTTNAKAFNPTGSIYYTEAERIEKYGLDHIAKAASTVIEYETDWNIDVERDDEPLAVDDEDGTPMDKSTVPGTPMDVDESRAGSPSNVAGQIASGKRGKGKKPTGVSESLEADGGLPGAKDGLAAFPPSSDFAELMLALKLKGKRYRTKKERMRMERGGPPMATDGSLDYPEMEDPFSILSALVPDPPSRPLLAPLFPTVETPDPFPAPVCILPSDQAPVASTSTATVTSNGQKLKNIKPTPTKRRHWVINRNAPSRRAKDVVEEETVPAWKTPREPVAVDFGSFATIPAVLAAEGRVQDIGEELGSEEKMFGVLRDTLEDALPASAPKQEIGDDDYWTGRAGEAEAYIRDVVYGGVDGFAYVRSLAEFLTPSEPVQQNGEPPTEGELGMPVARWVEQHVIDPLTDGRHGMLRAAARMLNSLPPTPPHTPPPSSPIMSSSPDVVRRQIEQSLHTYPAAARTLATLRAIYAAKIDLPALIRSPDELFRAEDEWAGQEYREKRKREMEEALKRDPEQNAAAYLQWAIAEHRQAEAGDGTGAGGARSGMSAVDEAGMLAYALDAAATDLVRFAKDGVAMVKDETKGEDVDMSRVEDRDRSGDEDVVMKTEGDEESRSAAPAGDGNQKSGEDPGMKKLRLTLLALAKRAPLDQIMKLPSELVPAHLRHIVPTVES